MRKFIKELWPLTPVRISYQLNILRLNEGNLTKFPIFIDIHKLWIGIVMHQLVQIYSRAYMTFKSCKNIVSAPYYKNGWMELDKL